MLSSPEVEEPRTSGDNPLFVHRKIEDDIQHFVENFKQKSSILDRRLSSDSGDSSGWTSSVFSTTDTPSTDSPDRDGELLPVQEEDLRRHHGIIAESRRIAQWAIRQARYASSRDSCHCSYHPRFGEYPALVHCPLVSEYPALLRTVPRTEHGDDIVHLVSKYPTLLWTLHCPLVSKYLVRTAPRPHLVSTCPHTSQYRDHVVDCVLPTLRTVPCPDFW